MGLGLDDIIPQTETRWPASADFLGGRECSDAELSLQRALDMNDELDPDVLRLVQAMNAVVTSYYEEGRLEMARRLCRVRGALWESKQVNGVKEAWARAQGFIKLIDLDTNLDGEKVYTTWGFLNSRFPLSGPYTRY